MSIRPSGREARVTLSSRFRKIEQIGATEGRNSTVWSAYDQQRGEAVILKEIALDTFCGDPAAYFEESQAICAAASDRVVPLYSAGKDSDFVYLTMPAMERSLASMIRDQPLGTATAIAIGQDICGGIEAVHKSGHNGRLHLDLKPTNVLFDERGRARVADFGQSLPLDRLGAAVGVARVYLPYWPPEMIDGQPLTVHSDVYQIGLTLYCTVNGAAWYERQLDEAFAAGDYEASIREGHLPNRAAFLPHVPDHLRRVIRQALAVDPTDRFESAVDLAEALGKVDPKHDWQVTRYDEDGYSWRLSGAAYGRADVIVHAHYDANRWDVEVWTQNETAPPRKRHARGEQKLWGKQLTWHQASVLLKRAFRRLP